MHEYLIHYKIQENQLGHLLSPFAPSCLSHCEELRVCVYMCMHVYECVWEVDRFPTWKWLAIIRCSVTRGYVRQLKLCFLTETWFMLLVVTVTTSERDRNQTQTKVGEINADSMHHSPDTLCLSVRALRLSGKEAPANSGPFLSPGTAG